MPEDASVDRCGISVLQLTKLIELKLTAGMSSELRHRDLSDVMELIQILSLPREFAEGLDPSVRDKFLDLWDKIEAAPKDELR
jgi:hypothetical protein